VLGQPARHVCPLLWLSPNVGGKWGKFSQQELTDLKDNDDLVAQLVAKYGLEKDAASRDAAAIVKGHAF
jgi:hypothetical protein